MARKWLLLVALLLTVCFGCSGKPKGRLDNDPATYAKDIKKRVVEFAQEARSNPRGMAQEAAVLLETLEVHPSQPVGDHKMTYEQLTEKCKSLVEAAKRSPSSAEAQKLVQEMEALAKQLPG